MACPGIFLFLQDGANVNAGMSGKTRFGDRHQVNIPIAAKFVRVTPDQRQDLYGKLQQSIGHFVEVQALGLPGGTALRGETRIRGMLESEHGSTLDGYVVGVTVAPDRIKGQYHLWF